MTDKKITVNFIKSNGERVVLQSLTGITLLQLAHMNKDKIYLEGACEGSLACTTCHVLLNDAWFDKVTSASDAEEDMLDLAFNVQLTSRLGCQIVLTEELDGLTVSIPSENRNVNINRDAN